MRSAAQSLLPYKISFHFVVVFFLMHNGDVSRGGSSREQAVKCRDCPLKTGTSGHGIRVTGMIFTKSIFIMFFHIFIM